MKTESPDIANLDAMDLGPAIHASPRAPQPLSITRPLRLGVQGFLPLPPILASPIETPSVSTSPEANVGSPSTNSVSLHVVVAAPTWISTPPTPPTKLMRHTSASFLQRTAPTTPLSPLASFPASMHAHAPSRQTSGLKKCISVPNLFTQSQASSEPSLSRASASLPSCPPFFQRIERTMELDRNRGFSNDSELDQELKKAGRPRKKPIFRLSNSATDNEEEGAFYSAESRPRSISDDHSEGGSWSDHPSEDVWGQEKSKDSLRKFFALRELLSTELGYLADLRTLVMVYLRNLPTLTTRSPTFNSTFGRASASFTSGPWATSSSHLQPSAITASATTDGSTMTLTAPSVKDSPKPNRYLFTDTELELVTRNAEDILQLHERFVSELQEALEPLGFTMHADIDEQPNPDQLENLESAIRVVSAKFATEASRFNAYQTFCAGHPEAIDLVRRVSHQHSSEWEAFESKCSLMASDIVEGVRLSETEVARQDTLQTALITEDRARALSLTSLDTAVRTLRLRYPSSAPAPDLRREAHVNRIAFVDYLIKPVQRICKYPLLFDQVLSSKALRSITPADISARPHVDVIVKSATQAMRHVASSVDEARHKQDVAVQTSLITSRMFLGVQALGSVSDSTVQGMSAEFLSSLGTCVLAGALDVMHQPGLQQLDGSTSIKAKYHAAFLYKGGYLILAKVLKGRRYEPKHWFNLSHFTISGIDEDEALLPHSIRVVDRGCEQHFELAASCQREKDVWLAALNSSVRDKAIWTNEPTPSYKLDDKGGLISTLDSEVEVAGGLPTILSIPELPNNNSDTDLTEPFFPYLLGPSKKGNKLRRPDSARPEPTPPPTSSRRSSTTSVRAMFVPLSDAESIVIRRCSPIARQQVDQGLQDVISQSCITARSYAFSRDAELFRSGSTTLSRTKSRLSKHESIRVLRSRTADNLDSMIARSASQYLNLASRRKTKKLSISSAPPNIDERKFFSRSPTSLSGFSTSPEPSSHVSTVPSLSSSNTSSTSTSSNTLLMPLTPINPVIPEPCPTSQHHKSRSFARGMKELFMLRPTNHPSPLSALPTPPPPQERPVEATASAARALSRLTGTIRRRPRTAPSRLDTNPLVNSSLPVPSVAAAV